MSDVIEVIEAVYFEILIYSNCYVDVLMLWLDFTIVSIKWTFVPISSGSRFIRSIGFF